MVHPIDIIVNDEEILGGSQSSEACSVFRPCWIT